MVKLDKIQILKKMPIQTQTKWGVGIIILGLFVFMIIGFLLDSEKDSEGIYILRFIYSVPLVLFGIAIILFRKREARIEQVKEDIK